MNANEIELHALALDRESSFAHHHQASSWFVLLMKTTEWVEIAKWIQNYHETRTGNYEILLEFHFNNHRAMSSSLIAKGFKFNFSITLRRLRARSFVIYSSNEHFQEVYILSLPLFTHQTCLLLNNSHAFLSSRFPCDYNTGICNVFSIRKRCNKTFVSQIDKNGDLMQFISAKNFLRRTSIYDFRARIHLKLPDEIMDI